MESDLNQCTLDQWVSSYPQSIPVDYSSTIFPLPFALSDLSLPPNSQISSNYPKRSDLGIEMEGGLWNNIGGKSLGPLSCSKPLRITAAYMCVDHMQLVPSPSSDYCRDIDARFTHDSSTPISTLPHDPYLVVQEQFRSAPWRRAGELEPKDPNTGRSVLYALLEERTGGNKGPIHKCRLCTRVFNRVDPPQSLTFRAKWP